MRQIWDRFEPKTKSKKTNSNLLEFYFLIFCTMFKSGPDSPISHYSSILNSNWRRGVVVITTAQIHSSKPELRFLRRFKSCSWRVGDSRWWGSLTMVPAGNKATPFIGQPYHKKIPHHSSSSFINKRYQTNTFHTFWGTWSALALRHLSLDHFGCHTRIFAKY